MPPDHHPTTLDQPPVRYQPPHRPWGVTLLALLHMLAAVILAGSFLTGSLLALRGRSLTRSDVLVLGMGILIPICFGGIGLGLWRLKRSTYWLSFVLTMLLCFNATMTSLTTNQARWPMIAVYAGVLLYLLQPRIRAAFH